MRKYTPFVAGEKLTPNTESITIDRYLGTWYVIDNTIHNGERLFLLENEQHGDDEPALIVDAYCNVILNDVYNGFEDLEDM